MEPRVFNKEFPHIISLAHPFLFTPIMSTGGERGYVMEYTRAVILKQSYSNHCRLCVESVITFCTEALFLVT